MYNFLYKIKKPHISDVAILYFQILEDIFSAKFTSIIYDVLRLSKYLGTKEISNEIYEKKIKNELGVD